MRLPRDLDRCTDRRTSRGFSLLEVLVAFVIIALVATAVFRLFSGALANAGAAEDYSRAVLLAESLLDGVAAAPLHQGTETGQSEDGRVQWKVEIAPYDAPDVNPDLERASAALPVRMYRVMATVTFPGLMDRPRTLALSTVRIGARETQ